MKLIDSLTMGERFFLLALLGGNGLIWGAATGGITYWIWGNSTAAVLVGAAVTYLVSVGALKLLERIHNAKQR